MTDKKSDFSADLARGILTVAQTVEKDEAKIAALAAEAWSALVHNLAASAVANVSMTPDETGKISIEIHKYKTKNEREEEQVYYVASVAGKPESEDCWGWSLREAVGALMVKFAEPLNLIIVEK